jgi:hypothetical protein
MNDVAPFILPNVFSSSQHEVARVQRAELTDTGFILIGAVTARLWRLT